MVRVRGLSRVAGHRDDPEAGAGCPRPHILEVHVVAAEDLRLLYSVAPPNPANAAKVATSNSHLRRRTAIGALSFALRTTITRRVKCESGVSTMRHYVTSGEDERGPLERVMAFVQPVESSA